jgi:hypothetical protein
MKRLAFAMTLLIGCSDGSGFTVGSVNDPDAFEDASDGGVESALDAPYESDAIVDGVSDTIASDSSAPTDTAVPVDTTPTPTDSIVDTAVPADTRDAADGAPTCVRKTAGTTCVYDTECCSCVPCPSPTVVCVGYKCVWGS